MTAEILQFERVSPLFPDICENLHLDADNEAIYMKRLFLLDGKPIAIGKSWLPSALLPSFIEQGLINNSLSTTLAQRYKITPIRVEDFFEVVRPTAAESGLLKNSNDAPLILVKGISYLDDGSPLEYSHTLWSGDGVRFHFTLVHTDRGFVMGP